MDVTLRLLRWFWRAWPVLVIAVLGVVHFLLIWDFGLDAKITNKTISFFTQIIGGLAILYTIDSNLGIISKKNFRAILGNYLIDFPLIKKRIVLTGTGSSMRTISGVGRVSLWRSPANSEEKIAYLQEQIDWLKQDFELEAKGIKEKIDRQSKELTIKIQETKLALQDIESKIVKVSTGGLRTQLFGILLIIYGSCSGYFA